MKKIAFIMMLFLIIPKSFLVADDSSSREYFILSEIIIQNRNDGSLEGINLGKLFPNGLRINGYMKELSFTFFYGDIKYFTPYPSFRIELGRDSHTLLGKLGVSLTYTHRFIGNAYSYFLPFEGFSGERDKSYSFLMSEIYFADCSFKIRERVLVESSFRFGLLNEVRWSTFLGTYGRAPLQISYRMGNFLPGLGFDFVTDLSNIKRVNDILPEATNVILFIRYQFGN